MPRATTLARALRWALALGCAFAPGLALAAPPIGSFEIAFGGNHSYWVGGEDDEDGFCSEYAASFGEVESCEFDTRVDGKGKLSGQLAFVAWDDGRRTALAGPLKGSQRGDGGTGISTMNLGWKLSGEYTDAIGPRAIKADLKYSGQIAPGGIASGTWDERYCIKGGGCQSFQSDAPVETLTNGDWLLRLEITDTGGGTLGGGARAEFADGGVCVFALRGKYNAKTDLSSLGFTPLNPDCAKTSIQLKEVRTPAGMFTPLAAQMKYNLFGLSGELPVFMGDLPRSTPTATTNPSPIVTIPE